MALPPLDPARYLAAFLAEHDEALVERIARRTAELVTTPPLVVGTVEAGRMLHTHRQHIAALVRAGELDNISDTSTLRIPVCSIEGYVARRCSAPDLRAAS